MVFRSDYPDLGEAACKQIDILFPRGSHSRLPDGSLPLDRIAAVGYRGLCQNIRQSPTEIRRMSGAMDNDSTPEKEVQGIAADICTWLVAKGLKVDGWPPPAVRSVAHPFLLLSNMGKARHLMRVIAEGKRLLLPHEKTWLNGVLSKISDYT